MGCIQFISVNPKREFGAQPQQRSRCALTYKLFVFCLIFCKGFKRCRVHKVNILLIVVGMIHKLTSYSESCTQLFPYKMHLHIDVENAYTKKAQTILDYQCSRAPCCYICTPATLAGCFCRHRWSALSRFSESYLKITQSWVIKYYT